jgi:hypothetical protein
MLRNALVNIVCLVLVFACAKKEATQGAPGSAPPTLPTHWTLEKDMSFGGAELEQVGAELGGSLSALRNTDYKVNGKSIRVNTIVAMDEQQAELVAEGLSRIKPQEFWVRDGLVFYEFVGNDQALEEIREGRDFLQKAASTP